MKRSYLSNVVLLALLIVLFVLFERHHKTPDITQLSPATQPEHISIIQIDRVDQSRIELKRTPTDWQLISPFQAPASESRVALLLNLLNRPAQPVLSTQDTDKLAEFGLADPALQLSLNTLEFTFGDLEKLSELRYVLHHDQVYLFEDDITDLMRANAAGFINHRLFLPGETVQQIRLPLLQADRLSDTTQLTLLHTDGQWKNTATDKPDPPLSTLGEAWQQAYAMQVMPYTEIPEEIVHSITFILTDQRSITLPVGLSEGVLSVFHPARQLRYHFPGVLAEAFFPTATD